jgi:hypothetical protein
VLNGTDAENTDSRLSDSDNWTSTFFKVGTYGDMNNNGSNHVAYVFCNVKGYCKVGTYTGGSDPFVYLGFKPAWIMFKNTSSAENWRIVDNKRDDDNPVVQHLFANSNAAEASGTSYSDFIDFLSNGFKIRSGSGEVDGSGNTIIYMAIAENPFVANDSGTAVPVTAR